MKKHADEILHSDKTQDSQQNNTNQLPAQYQVPQAFKQIHSSIQNNTQNTNTNKNTSFTGIQDFMFSPTKNLMIVDASISTERICESRNKQDAVGYAIKEGSFWAFMYFLGEKIQTHFENSAEKKHDRNIQLDARVIESEDLKNALKDKNLKNKLQAFSLMKKDADIYDFICNKNNKNDIIVKLSKMSDIISVINSKDLNSAVDTRKYIDIEEVKGVKDKLLKLQEQLERFTDKMHKENPKMQNDEILEVFLKDLRKLKRGSILKNIGSCIGALGIVAPAIMVGMRFIDKNNRDFKVKTQIEEKLAQDIKNGTIIA